MKLANKKEIGYTSTITKGARTMRRKLLVISSILLVATVGIVGCGKKSPSSPEATTEEATTEATTEVTSEDESSDEQTVATTETEATSEETSEVTTASKADAAESAKSASGTFGGWIDSNSVEIEMSNGEYKTFFVNDSKVKTAINKKGEGSKLSFTYKMVAGQANAEIVSVK